MSKSTIVCLVVAVMATIFVLAYLSKDEVERSMGWRVHSKMGYNYQSAKSKELARVLRKATMDDRTVIITTLDEAWASPNSIFDIFLESFHVGEQTEQFLSHLVVVATDQKALARCKSVHDHCFFLTTHAKHFASERGNTSLDYLKTWSRIELLKSVVELGYSFIYTDIDIMWLRNPLPRIPADASVAIATDIFFKDSWDLRANCGFFYAFPNTQTIEFFKYWLFNSKLYPDKNEQQIFNIIKRDTYVTSHLGLELEFLDTNYFGGFCQPSRDFNKVCTMHANCCVEMDRKIHDLRDLLQDWKSYKAKPEKEREEGRFSWSVPNKCS